VVREGTIHGFEPYGFLECVTKDVFEPYGFLESVTKDVNRGLGSGLQHGRAVRLAISSSSGAGSISISPLAPVFRNGKRLVGIEVLMRSVLCHGLDGQFPFFFLSFCLGFCLCVPPGARDGRLAATASAMREEAAACRDVGGG